jgi:hypothetical protein
MCGKWRIYNRQEFEEGKSKPPPRHILKSKISRKDCNVFHTKDIEATIEKGRKWVLRQLLLRFDVRIKVSNIVIQR